MMSAAEILKAINELPNAEQRALVDQLQQALSEKPSADEDELARREREFALEMLAEGFFSSIPKYPLTDDDDDDWEPLELEGEPLSEQIIRERI
jgi:hypothetical protein